MSPFPLNTYPFLKLSQDGSIGEIHPRDMTTDADGRFISLFESEAAARRAPTQTGASNCGETAVKASLMALKLKEASSGSVVVRARDYSTRSMLQYLRSRAVAGCTGADLVAGATSLSGGKATAKFFACGPEPPNDLCAWLDNWIGKGAAPIVTINTQLDGADYWHHQAVLGVHPHSRELVLANPYEKVKEAELARLLGSDRVMLIMASDVLQRCPPPADELVAMRADARWAALDTAGHIEAMAAADDERSDRRLAIPASYIPGVTLIAASGSECAKALEEAASPWSSAVHDWPGL